MVSEDPLGDRLQLVGGMLIAAVPASILAIRIGRMRLSAPRVLWSGVCGLWLPLAFSVAVVSLAKMAGARLFWKPSLPIEFQYAFVWIVAKTDSLRLLLWPLAMTLAPPCIICAMWIKDLTDGIHGTQRKLGALAVTAAVGFAVASSFAWALYFRYWLWSIVVGSVAACALRILFAVRARFRHSDS